MCERLSYRRYDARTVVRRARCVRHFDLRAGESTLWRGLLLLLALAAFAATSEFPERECCDPVYPPNTATTPSAPVTHPVSKPVVLSTVSKLALPKGRDFFPTTASHSTGTLYSSQQTTKEINSVGERTARRDRRVRSEHNEGIGTTPS
ncbi:hypothetical protein EVAR_852_1 [Eumeta japonica]|uniref:Uncharacterized protein n=1 Tax=Eumeta variegata TaxID=151549 RepID=A0A4C1SDJ5_EUMVA|nr:hypothetical protein EVAR_852_1 [Eumeta japonica]